MNILRGLWQQSCITLRIGILLLCPCPYWTKSTTVRAWWGDPFIPCGLLSYDLTNYYSDYGSHGRTTRSNGIANHHQQKHARVTVGLVWILVTESLSLWSLYELDRNGWTVTETRVRRIHCSSVCYWMVLVSKLVPLKWIFVPKINRSSGHRIPILRLLLLQRNWNSVNKFRKQDLIPFLHAYTDCNAMYHRCTVLEAVYIDYWPIIVLPRNL